jgi:hypothetical protein
VIELSAAAQGQPGAYATLLQERKVQVIWSPNGLAQRQRLGRRDSHHYRGISGKQTLLRAAELLSAGAGVGQLLCSHVLITLKTMQAKKAYKVIAR